MRVMHANPIDSEELKKAQRKEIKMMQPLSAEKMNRAPPEKAQNLKNHILGFGPDGFGEPNQ